MESGSPVSVLALGREPGCIYVGGTGPLETLYGCRNSPYSTPICTGFTHSYNISVAHALCAAEIFIMNGLGGSSSRPPILISKGAPVAFAVNSPETFAWGGLGGFGWAPSSPVSKEIRVAFFLSATEIPLQNGIGGIDMAPAKFLQYGDSDRDFLMRDRDIPWERPTRHL